MQRLIRLTVDYAGHKAGDTQPASRPVYDRLIALGYAEPIGNDPGDDLTEIENIGPARAAALAEMGIDTFQALADADPADIDEHLDGTDRTMAEAMIAGAQAILAELDR